MLDSDKRQVARALYREGKPKKRIARLLDINIKTVRNILSDSGDGEGKPRSDSIEVDEGLLRGVYERCSGYKQRVHEVLTEEHDVDIGYSTLTRKIRELGLGENKSKRSERHPDEPGMESQHDTSPYVLTIGGKRMSVICSGLYLRYSKLRYIKFYPRFNRFTMKCFMEEALGFWGYVAKTCIIDNTNLAVLYGTGARAVMVPEMALFARNYGFEWKAHELKHSNRKAGTERNFWTVETNFFPGRTFSSLEDLNKQALEWATVRYAKRPQSKTGLIPIDTYEYEKSFLKKIPEYVPPVIKDHHRNVDEYGYVSFKANFYWVPERYRGKERIKKVVLLQYANRVAMCYHSEKLVEYPLPAHGVRNERFAPEGVSLRRSPRQRKLKSADEEKRLREMGEMENQYVDFVLSKESKIHYKHQFLRRLYALSRKLAPALWRKVIQRALSYRVSKMEALNRIAFNLVKTGDYGAMDISVDHEYMNREAYLEGRLNSEPGFNTLKNILDPDEEGLDDT